MRFFRLSCNQWAVVKFDYCFKHNVFTWRDYLDIALKDQLLRKISSKRTVKIKTLERELKCSTEGLRSQVFKTDEHIDFE